MPRYAPWSKGRYEVAPGLRPLGTDFGNGEWDGRVFQLDDEAPKLLENKRVCLAENPAKYRRTHNLSGPVERAAIDLIRARIALDAPNLVLPDDAGLDELAMLVPEDIAIVATEGTRDWFAYGNLCAASHWAVGEKIGKSFVGLHEEVPGFSRTAAVAEKMIEAMVQRGPFVRFVWGVESDDRANHHPEAPPGWDQAEWRGRRFAETGRFFVRVERQCLHPMPEVRAALFTIRLSWWSTEEILANEALRRPLEAALCGMSKAEREYKGVDKEFEALMRLVEHRHQLLSAKACVALDVGYRAALSE